MLKYACLMIIPLLICALVAFLLPWAYETIGYVSYRMCLSIITCVFVLYVHRWHALKFVNEPVAQQCEIRIMWLINIAILPMSLMSLVMVMNEICKVSLDVSVMIFVGFNIAYCVCISMYFEIQ